MDLIEFEEKRQMSREEAAGVLRKLADNLARHNDLEFTREGLRYTVDVPDRVEVEVEIEIGDKESELEVKVSW